jgi:sigma-54 dependent transcriptional regulator, acetoin dehydrogenase operon transcriptional activator AcoR
MPTSAKKHEEIVRHSFARSMSFGLERRQNPHPRIISKEELIERQAANEELITITEPTAQALNGYFNEKGTFLVLTDSEGCILKVYGDSQSVKGASKCFIMSGAFADEENLGSTSIGIVLHEKHPIQLASKDHFHFLFNEYTSAGAPITNEEGTLIAVLSIFFKSESVAPNTINIVQAAALGISTQVRNSHTQQSLEHSNRLLSTIINTLNHGLIAVNADGNVLCHNKTALLALGLGEKELGSRNISDILPQWESSLSTLKRNERIFDEEVTFENVPVKERYAVNLLPTIIEGEFVGAVILVREMKRVYNIVNKFTGMSARYTFEDIIGESYEMQRVIEYAKIVANSPSTILIDGESGTGKELLAQSIHNYSNRRNAGFVAVNCGALPESLIESELFGYDSGAFTGASKGGKPGKFELANGGTLFLDEVGEMPLDMQVKLLRVIQEGVITRVGGTKNITVDVRIIAATNKDLKEEIKEGRFRLDLYYRLSVIPLRLPSLRERKEDIPMLINYFLQSKALKLNKDVPDISPEVYRFLLSYSWPGNVRELENFIEKTVNLNGNIVWDVTKDQVKNLPNVGTAPHRGSTSSKTTLTTLDEMEKRMIKEAIKELNSNISQVAKTLGISRNTLYLKMKKYGIDH